MVSDDRFFVQTLDHWNFGLDKRQYLLDLNNGLHAMKGTAEMGDVLLVTADGNTTARRVLVNRNQLCHPFTTVKFCRHCIYSLKAAVYY
jgi:hypothetical protein